MGDFIVFSFACVALPLVLGLPLLWLTVYLAVRRERAKGRGGPKERGSQFRLADLPFLAVYVGMPLCLAQVVLTTVPIEERAVAPYLVAIVVTCVILWYFGVRLAGFAGIDRPARRVAFLLVLPIGAAGAVALPESTLFACFVILMTWRRGLPAEICLLVPAFLFGLVALGLTFAVAGWACGSPRSRKRDDDETITLVPADQREAPLDAPANEFDPARGDHPTPGG
ncbi:MAG: hypothetical protein HYS13_14465 [Planctomycetia bacterium]|nr:hypothetical protein [Planctomycetia bacterium]